LVGTFSIVGGTQLQLAVTTSSSAQAAPVITSSTTATGTVGVAFTYNITATNSPTSYTLSGAPLPQLSLAFTTGVLSGTPDASGTFIDTIGASNVGGTGTQTLTITIAPAPTTAPSSSGGGAPSAWFYVALAVLGLVRLAVLFRRKSPA